MSGNFKSKSNGKALMLFGISGDAGLDQLRAGADTVKNAIKPILAQNANLHHQQMENTEETHYSASRISL